MRCYGGRRGNRRRSCTGLCEHYIVEEILVSGSIIRSQPEQETAVIYSTGKAGRREIRRKRLPRSREVNTLADSP